MQKNKTFNTFLGIDVSKDKLDIHFLGKNFTISNSKKEIKKFIKSLSVNIDDTFVIIDLTGGYESLAVEMFYEAGFRTCSESF